MNNLRPIGTRFEYVYPPHNTNCMNFGVKAGASSDGDVFTVFIYEVEGYSDTVYGKAERLKPVSHRIVRPLGWRSFAGFVTAIPPDDLLPLLPADWREPITIIVYIEGKAA